MLFLSLVGVLRRSKQGTDNITGNFFVLVALVGHGKQEGFTPEVICAARSTRKFCDSLSWIRFDIIEHIACREVFLEGTMEKAEIVTCAQNKEAAALANTAQKVPGFLCYLIRSTAFRGDGLR